MSTYSRKQTETRRSTSAKAGKWITRDSGKHQEKPVQTNKFQGMSQNIEEVKAVVIPGYRLRG